MKLIAGVHLANVSSGLHFIIVSAMTISQSSNHPQQEEGVEVAGAVTVMPD